MSEYLRPDVYVEDASIGKMPIQTVATSTGGFIGITPRGKVGVATLVTSWNDFCLKFARGLSSPFMSTSYLAYSVYGFFLNGGTRCYITRIANGAKCAEVTVPATTGVLITAIDEGAWANTKLKVEIANGKKVGKFNVIVSLNGVVVEAFNNITSYANEVNGISNYITIAEGETLEVGVGTFSGGLDGSALIDADYLGANGLLSFNTVNDVNLIAIPGQTSNAVLKGILDYCALRKNLFAVLDVPLDTDTTEALAIADEVVGDFGAMYYPWGTISDPLNKQGKLKLIPPSGYIMGIYSRTDKQRGVHKSPAGTEALVRGFVSLERPITNEDLDVLNPEGINCIVSKPGVGIVVWGARTCSSDISKKYISDVRLDIKIKVSAFLGTQWAVFEPNDPDLWLTLEGSLSAMMYELWLEGALKGETSEEAYYVKCDEELNPVESQDSGKVVCEIGYAKKKPGEFIVIRFAQDSISAE